MEHGQDGKDGIGGGSGRLILAEETFAIRRALYQVHKTLGGGFLEAVYQECLELEFGSSGLPFTAFPRLRIEYRGIPLKQTYSPDFVCFDRVILEIKAARVIAPEHRAQTMNYLRATGMKVGLLANFGALGGIQIERFAL